MRTFRVSRIRGEIRLRHAPRARLPAAPRASTPRSYRGRARRGRSARRRARRGSRSRATRPGGSSALFGRHGRIEDGVFVTDYSDLGAARLLDAAPGRPRRAALAARARRQVRGRLEAGAQAPRGQAAEDRGERPPAGRARTQVERPAGPVAPERFGLLQALLAYLLARCGDGTRRGHPRRGASPSASTSRPSQLEEHLAAPEPRQLRRRLLRRLRGARTATRSTSRRSSSATRSARRPG